MIALPSIAFEGFSGSAKGVTARQVGGRTVLGVRSYPTGFATVAQMVRRSALSKITKAYKTLTAEQQRSWELLAESASGASVFGQKAKLSGHNLFVRLNSNRAYVGEAELLASAPALHTDIPLVSYTDFQITEDSILFVGVPEPVDGLLLVAKMSDGQSSGVSSAWGKTVIISPDRVPDWGDIDLTEAFIQVMGYAPINGQKYFVEMYWIDPATGATGIPVKESRVCQAGSAATGEPISPRITVRDGDIDEMEGTVSLDVEFGPGSTLVTVDASFSDMPDNQMLQAVLKESRSGRMEDFDSYILGRGSAEAGLKPMAFIFSNWHDDYNNQDALALMQVGGGACSDGLIFGTCPCFAQ